MVTSCSRLAWAHNRESLATSLALIGARNPPTRIDDAYALIGVKGASAPLAEARTPCCTSSLDMQGQQTTVCHTCDQTVAKATADVACGASISAGSNVLTGYLGSWASGSYQAAVAAIAGSNAGLISSSSGDATPTSMVGVIAALQAEDADRLDSACETDLADGLRVRHGAQLATDGDPSSYWLSVGRSDALITLDFGTPRLVRSLGFDWRYPASSVMLLYSEVSTGNSWSFGGSHTSSIPTSLTLPGTGVIARRLRLYMADPANVTWPMFGLNDELLTSSRPGRVTQP